MAGVYGEIDSRVDFERVLNEALASVKRLRARLAQDTTLETIQTQLEAMERWSANARVPSEDERESIDIGLLAARELEDTGDAPTDALGGQLQALNNYFEDWPSDEEAANATDDDFFDDDD